MVNLNPLVGWGEVCGFWGGEFEIPRKPLKFYFRSKNMNQKITFRVGFSILVFAAAGLLVAPAPGYSQTGGMERREDRRDDRQDARETKQTGREEGRDAKAACREEGGSGPECRQEKREIKQKARGEARDIKRD